MKTIITSLAMVLCGSMVLAIPRSEAFKETESSSFRTVSNSSFKVGEVLRYRLHYGPIDAGETIFKVKDSDRKVKGRSLIHIVATGRSVKAFDPIYRVRDRYESYIDKDGLFPWVFIRRVDEGGYKLKQDYTFFQHKQKVDDGKGKTHEVDKFVQDMVSAFYYARTLNFEDLKEGDTFTIKTFVDEESIDLQVQFMGKETIKLRKGKFRCLKFQPVVIEGRTFAESDDLQVWITDDKNRIPILAKAEIIFGSIKMEVVEYKNLLNPIAKVEK